MLAKGSTDWDLAQFAHKWPNFKDQIGELPVAECSVTQIGRGSSIWQSAFACGKDYLVGQACHRPQSSTQLVPDSGWVYMGIALHWRGSFAWNGKDVDPHTLFVCSEPEGFIANGAERNIISIAVRRQRLLSACSALSGTTPDQLKLRNLFINLGPKTGAELLNLFLLSLADATCSPVSDGQYKLPIVRENDSISTIACILLPFLVAEKTKLMSHPKNAALIVRAAERSFDDYFNPPSLAEMCMSAGVGQTLLNKCFAEVHGVPPMQYMRQKRLSVAREMFQDANLSPRSVKFVAMSLGFSDLGRFSQYYRSIFGENPSQTLEANRCIPN